LAVAVAVAALGVLSGAVVLLLAVAWSLGLSLVPTRLADGQRRLLALNN
jgi:hypothetical protein